MIPMQGSGAMRPDSHYAQIIKETRGMSCPKCNPALDDPDYVTGDRECLKYLIWDRKCRNCGTQLTDLGVMEDPRLATSDTTEEEGV